MWVWVFTRFDEIQRWAQLLDSAANLTYHKLDSRICVLGLARQLQESGGRNAGGQNPQHSYASFEERDFKQEIAG